MSQRIFVQLIGAACGLATLLAAHPARALDKYLDLEPAQTKSGLGYGYNSISREFVLRQCVQFEPAVTDGSGGASGDAFKFSSIVSNAQLADEMGLSVATKFSASMGVASASTSAKVDFFQSTKTNLLTHTILASYNNVEPMKYIAGDLNLKPEYLAMLGTPAFRQQCGDYVIVGEQKGRWFYGTVQLVVKDTLTESKLAANGAVEAQYGTASAEANVSSIKKLKDASQSQDLQIRVTSSGTNSASLTVDQFLAQVSAFPGAAGPGQTYKLKAVPYEAIVANWPVTDPLAPMTSEQKLTRVAEAAWGLTALIADSNFVMQHAALFALGTTPAKRDARLAFIKARRNWYQGQLDGMRGQAKNCDVDWAGTAACEALYNKWKDWETFAVDEYEQFPARYTADCYAARDAGTQIQDALQLAFGAANGKFGNTKGDREVGGGPVKFSAHLDLKPDFTGGDPLAVRKLLAALRVKIEEDKADHTTFEATVKPHVFDLAAPDLSQGAPVTLGQCAYQGTGVKAAQVTEDPKSCDPLKTISQAAYDACIDIIHKSKYHGILRGRTGEDPRTELFSKNGRGVLSSMTCTVDSDQGNDTSIIGCSQVGLRSIQLDLVNTQDLAADKWSAPKVIDAAVISGGIIPRPEQTATLTKLLVRKGKITPSQVFRTCKAGLVSVGGECVKATRR